MGGQLGRVRRRASHGLIARLDELAARPGRQLIHSEGWELGERERRATGLVPERAWQIAVGPGGRCTALLIARLAGPVVAKFEKYCVPLVSPAVPTVVRAGLPLSLSSRRRGTAMFITLRHTSTRPTRSSRPLPG